MIITVATHFPNMSQIAFSFLTIINNSVTNVLIVNEFLKVFFTIQTLQPFFF